MGTRILQGKRIQYISILKESEGPFLNKMNEIVFKYDEISQQKVKELKKTGLTF